MSKGKAHCPVHRQGPSTKWPKSNFTEKGCYLGPVSPPQIGLNI